MRRYRLNVMVSLCSSFNAYVCAGLSVERREGGEDETRLHVKGTGAWYARERTAFDPSKGNSKSVEGSKSFER